MTSHRFFISSQSMAAADHHFGWSVPGSWQAVNHTLENKRAMGHGHLHHSQFIYYFHLSFVLLFWLPFRFHVPYSINNNLCHSILHPLSTFHPLSYCHSITLISIFCPLSHAIFICSHYHYFDLCFTLIYSHYFYLLSSIFYSLTLSCDLLNPLPFRLLSSVLCSYFDSSLLPFIFHLPSYVPLFHFLSTICSLFLAFPSWPWQLNNPSLVTLWVIFFTFSILHHSLYYSEPCSIKFFPILYLFPSL